MIGRTTICGEVNAKNGFGSYAGMQPFVYFPDNDRAELITAELINKLGTVPMARDTIDAELKDCRHS